MKMNKFMTGYKEVIDLSPKNYTTPHLNASLLVGRGWVYDTHSMSSHPNINLPAMNKLAITLPSFHECAFSSSFLRAITEKFALWLKKCLLMQHMTRKSELRLLMATG
jgi:hypothetical protein